MIKPDIETEAKFIVPDFSTFLALQQLRRLDDFELKPIGSQTVIDRYLDTEDKHLYQAGFACRLRNVKTRQVLTLKSLTPAEGLIHRRREVEQEVEMDQFENWAEGEASEMITEIIGQAPLQTLFTLYQTRHKFHAWRRDQPVIEFSLDEVSLGDATLVDYFELEAELLENGTEADLILFVKTLQARWPLKVDRQSKFERAWAYAALNK